MNSSDKIKSLFKQAELSINPDVDEQIFQDVLQAKQKIKESTPARPETIWRIFMKNNMIKIAITAIVVITGAIGLMMLNRTSSIAIADVQARIKQISSSMYKISFSGKIGTDDMEMEGTVLESEQYGLKLTMTMNTGLINSEDFNNVTVENYFLLPKNTFITIMHSLKFYEKMEITDEMIEEANFNIIQMIEQIDESEIKSLGKSTLDGIEVEGFQFNDPNFQAGEFVLNKVDIKMWVDVKTELPVIMEMESSSDTQHMVGKISDFQWNVPVSAADFEPVIPSDYKSSSDMKKEIADLRASLPGYNEETVIQGLKLFAEVSGRYPTEPNTIVIINEYGKFKRQNNFNDNKIQELSNDHTALELITEIRYFFKRLEREDKDPVYYGDVVTPNDVDKVLMRWKVSDDMYRVVFGNLEAGNVSANDLAKLEKNLPQRSVPVGTGDLESKINPESENISEIRALISDPNEETTIQALKLFVNVTGHYPIRLNITNIVEEFLKFKTQNISDANKPQELINAYKESEVFVELLSFFRRLERQRKDPAYYGDKVTPDDADQVLMRWIVSDDQYRVIFGNLEVGNVSADDLAKLEANLPK